MNPKAIAAITAALLAVGAWVGLKSGDCIDATLVCDWSLGGDAGTDIIASPHEEAVTVRGEVVPEKVDPGGLRCKVAKVGTPYACAIVGASLTRLSDDKLADGCSCSDGSGGCEMVDPASDPKDPKWIRATRQPNNLGLGQWRGTCVPKPCVEHAEMISGIGAVNPLSYSSPVSCAGPGKKPPSGTVMTADQVAKSDAAKSAEVVK